MLPLINSSYFQNLVEGFTNGVLIVNTDGDTYVANTAAAHTLGCSLNECSGSNWRDLLLPGIAYKQEFSEFMAVANAPDRCNLPFFTPYRRPDGTTLYFSLTTSPLIDSNKIFGIMILITDVTSLHKMHERETQILEERNILQQERFESLKNLSTAVAHQIRNPMMTIGGLANLLIKKNGNSEENPYLQGIVEASRRLEEIVSAVSDYTSLSMHESRSQSIEEVILDAQREASAKARIMGREVTWNVAIEPADLVMDKELVQRALGEVLQNALEAFENGGGNIELTGRRNESMYHLVISDDGPGFAKDSLPYLTDPFYTTKAVGVGMGLCKAKQIIDEHNGELKVLHYEPGAGAGVEIELPLAD